MRLCMSKTEFESDEHLKAWLIRVTVNARKKFFLSPWRKKVTELDENIHAEPTAAEFLLDIVKTLPSKYSTVIYLHYYEEMQINEIAKSLELNENTVKTRLRRAKEQIRKKLKGTGYEI
jgi:RNA polymerase sigma-70 factor (ECF subfamily)